MLTRRSSFSIEGDGKGGEQKAEAKGEVWCSCDGLFAAASALLREEIEGPGSLMAAAGEFVRVEIW
jgi:hypothetical protein